MDKKEENIAMKRVKVFALLLMALSPYIYCKFFGNCCWVNYTNDIQKFTEPMQTKLSEFITANKRAPDPDEKEILLKEVGCKDISRKYNRTNEFYCTFKGRVFSVDLGDGFIATDEDNPPYSHGYFMKTKYSTSFCSAHLYSNTKPEKAHCSKLPCITLKQ